ncbi:hypothetical protein I7I50_06563 [Histoplasma capsulatum G186AR]|uniref:Uncharacterized protein n=1 Tax=Ajellomyces capsulatus TaxID=5037 RepID=A0A8H7Z0N9_AJECA|nr:hypothetical protein I7I52_10365 [Histoplasma capsulatum]QSS67468.1 hypothetical protein I7I50_06563 [Histoplasma capsulatum G186AR]
MTLQQVTGRCSLAAGGFCWLAARGWAWDRKIARTIVCHLRRRNPQLQCTLVRKRRRGGGWVCVC